VKVGAVEDELRRMWKAIAGAEERDGKPAVMRASSLNLLVVATGEAMTDRAVRAIADVMNHHPVRAIVMTVEPQAATSGLEAQVSIHCSLPPVGGKQICGEQIMISASGEVVAELHSAAASLLLADLPAFLWWPGTPAPGSHLFDSLLDICDHLVIDSAQFDQVQATLPQALSLREALTLGDLNWLRLTPWRELTAQFFDAPHLRPYLDQLDKVIIECESGPDDGQLPAATQLPSQAQALLIIGWLASRLGWETTPQPLQLNSGGRVVAIEFETAAPRGGPGREGTAGELLSLRLKATGAERPTVFSVTRARDGVCVITRAEVEGSPPVERAAQIAARDEAELLCVELDTLNRDVHYEEALRAACELIELHG
jgi:glucose-6-phosphate dehydrogenase assembly protein OpcA